jgi:hypothetical protein
MVVDLSTGTMDFEEDVGEEQEERGEHLEGKYYFRVLRPDEEIRQALSFNIKVTSKDCGHLRIGQEELVSCSSDYSTRWLAIK